MTSTAINILKHQIQSTTRKLSAKWTFETNDRDWVDMTRPCNLSLDKLITLWYVANHCTMIPICDFDVLVESREWVEANTKGFWKCSSEEQCLSNADFVNEISRRIQINDLNPKPTSTTPAEAHHGIDVEAEIMAALAKEISHEVDREILSGLSGSTQAKLAKGILHRSKKHIFQYYYFNDVQEALRFKLTWGGE